MTRAVTLINDVRTFQMATHNSKQLSRTGTWLKAGAKIEISEPVVMVYDHRDQEAVSFVFEENTYFILLNEMATLELVD